MLNSEQIPLIGKKIVFHCVTFEVETEHLKIEFRTGLTIAGRPMQFDNCCVRMSHNVLSRWACVFLRHWFVEVQWANFIVHRFNKTWHNCQWAYFITAVNTKYLANTILNNNYNIVY